MSIAFIEKLLPISEAHIQAEFYHQARLRMVDCLLCANTTAGVPDVLILNRYKKIVAIIEVKRDPSLFDDDQIARYESLGLPVLKLSSIDGCAPLLDSLHPLL